MQGRERHQRLERLQDGVVDDDRAEMAHAAVNHPMADRHKLAARLVVAQPGDEMHQRLLVTDPLVRSPGHLVEVLAGAVPDDEVRLPAEAFKEPLADDAEVGGFGFLEDLELEARRARVEDHENGGGHGVTPPRPKGAAAAPRR